MGDQQLAQAAIAFARKSKKEIAAEETDTSKFPPERDPVSVFMAGSPGAGKTEASIELLDRFRSSGGEVIRIDPDELRKLFPGYNGANSNAFQAGVSILVARILDMALKQGQSYLLDGTLAGYDIARANIERCLKRGRLVQILFVYQDPLLAWEFVKKREALEGRSILKKDFINQYFESRRVVNQLKKEFGGDVKVDLLVKNTDKSSRFYKANIDYIDNHVSERYTSAALESELTE